MQAAAVSRLQGGLPPATLCQYCESKGSRGVIVDTAVAHRQRRITWILGGILLIVPALIDIVLQAAAGVRLGWISGLIFLLTVIVFTVGVGPIGSVTARRPLGTISALVFAVLLAAGALLPALFPPAAPASSGDEAQVVARGAMLALSSLGITVVALVFGIIAAVQIGRAGVVPRPWCWAPLWVLLAGVLSSLLGMLLPMLLVTSGLLVPQIPNLVSAVVLGAAVIFLGVVAIMLAVREGRAQVAPA
jgi:hypothetical protein